jgi:hypothetical protein
MRRGIWLALLCACSTPGPIVPAGGGDPAALAPIPSAPAPAGLATFRSLYEHVLARRCAIPSCHGGSFEPSLGSATGAYDALVHAPAAARPRTLRVVAGDPDRSYLLERLTQDGPLPRMPFNFPPLPDEEIALVRDWVASGALFDIEGPAPARPNFPPETPEPFVYRGEERIDDPPPAGVRVGEGFALWTTPRDFESAESCTLPHEGDRCVPWVAFAFFDADYRGLCTQPSPVESGATVPYHFAVWDADGRIEGGARQPGWRADVALPAEGPFAPVADGARCDMTQAETRPLAGRTLHLLVVFPEDAGRSPRYSLRVEEGHLRVEP